MTERVVHVGFREDVASIYGAADVIAVPSKQPDPFPNAALEAAAAGCCVVASNHGGLPEILRDGATGVLVPPDDPVALAGALAALADDPERRAALGAAAAADVGARLTPERMLAEVQALLRRAPHAPLTRVGARVRSVRAATPSEGALHDTRRSGVGRNGHGL